MLKNFLSQKYDLVRNVFFSFFRIPLGWFRKKEKTSLTTQKAIEIAFEIKKSHCTYNSLKGFKSRRKIFLQYLTESGKLFLPVNQFSRVEARDFLSWVDENKQVTNTTWNNYKSEMRSLFGDIKKEGHIEINPFGQIKDRKEERKIRVAFKMNDRKVILEHLKRHDEQLFIACMIQYYCAVRPVELTRIRMEIFDFDLSVIRVHETDRKKGDYHISTIPKKLNDYIKVRYGKMPKDYFVFTSDREPGVNQIAKDTLSKRHKALVKRLFKEKKISRMQGYHFYSWKDDGITDHSKIMNVYELASQKGVKPETLMKYYHPSEVKFKIRNIKDDLI